MVDGPNGKQADDVAVRLLHDYGRSLVAGTYDLFHATFHLPCLVEVSGSARIIASERALERTYKTIRGYFELHDIRDVVSTIVAVENLSSNRLGCTGVLCLLKAENVRFRSPFPVYFIADRSTDSWRISCAIYTIIDAPDLVAALEAKTAR